MTTTEALAAWLLHKRPSGDSSVRVNFFTREKGIVVCLYKGGRTPKKQAILQPFSPLWLALDIRNDWHNLRTLEAVSPSLQLKGVSLFAALYLNELIYYALRPFDPHPDVYDAYQFTVQGLSATDDRLVIESLLRRFEWILLSACGYPLSPFEADSNCSLVDQYCYRFIAGHGFVMDKNGFSGSSLLAIVHGEFEDVSILKPAKLIMRQAIDHLLSGREIKSRAFFSKTIAVKTK